MNRKILIITNPGELGAKNYCNGVYVDAQNYRDYFKEPYGGYWSDSEIKVLDKPSKSTVEIELLQLSFCDFSIIIFCGHGFYSSISNSNILELNKSERIDSMDLRKNGKKRILILDSCREVHAEYLSESLKKSRDLFSNYLGAVSKLNSLECKKYYNQTIEECSNQLIVAYAADINELAGDSSTKGGYYSYSLLKASSNAVESVISSIDLSSKYSVIEFPLNHNSAIPLVQNLSGGSQNPQIEKPRIGSNGKYLPFAILA